MIMQSGFQPSCEVTDPRILFGHNQPGALLDQLVTQLRLGTNVQLLGERRAGKTSLLKCCIARLRDEVPQLIPVYLNYREHHLIKGYANAHRLLLAHMHATVVAQGRPDLPSELNMRGIILSSNPLPETHYDTLTSVADYQIDGLLEAYLRTLGEYSVGIALLLDEYEHLMRHTFGGQEGAFSHLRSLSSEPPPRQGIPKPLTYIVAGALPWDRLCHMIGSPELNNIGAVFFIEPLDFEAFQEMWEQCLNDSSPTVRERVAGADLELAAIYELAGGWPFYGKIIGHLLSAGHHQENEFYEALLQHFGVIWSRLTPIERKQLTIAEQGLPQRMDPSIRTLIRRGLLEIDQQKGRLRPRGRLWSQYIREQLSETIPEATGRRSEVLGAPEERLRLMVDEVAVLVAEINETSLNLHGHEIFLSSNQDARTYIDLRKPAFDADQFTHFALSLYNLVYERTTGPKLVKVVASDGKSIVEEKRFRALERLPKRFRRKRTIVRVVDVMRHHFGKGHLTRLESFNVTGSGMSVGDVLERYLGSRAHPRDHQYLDLQFAVLKDMIAYLEELRDYLFEEAKKQAPGH